MATTMPPPPAPKPGRVKVFRAVYDYTARSAQEMTFSEGDIIYVSEEGPNADWLSARCGNKTGLVPANYVVSEQVEQLSFPLHEAAKRGNMDFLIECIQNQVSVNSLDKSGSTALYWACHAGHTDISRYLLQQPNINVSSQNKIGDTPLHAASWRGHKDCVQLIMDNNANVWCRNQDRKTPYDVAKDAEIAAILSRRMKEDTHNEDELNEYASGSDND